MKTVVKMRQKGQVTIREEVRVAMGLKTGDILELDISKAQVETSQE